MKPYYKEKRFANFRELINYSTKKYKKKIAFHFHAQNGALESIYYKTLRESYYRLCSFMLDCGLGGKRIAVVGRNCYEWVLSYLCASTVGVVVPIDKELHADDVENYLRDSDCSAVCTDGKIKLSSDNNRLVIDFKALRELSDGARYNIGKYFGEKYPINEKRVDAVELPKDKMQVLIFTSGTTGSSKGVCLSQFNICSNIHSTVSMVKITHADRTLSVLPLHHTYECTLNCLLLLSRGACITYADSISKLARNFTEYSPTVLVVVPALLKFLDKRISKTIAADCPKKYKELYETLSLAAALGKTPYLIRKIICMKVLKSLGGKLRLFIVGAADLDTTIVADFNALGIRTLQGYGLTECAPLLAGNNDFYADPASTGRPIPGVELKINQPNADGIGEILAKGDNIMLGYFNDDDATNRVMRGGWFHTGDLGCLDKNGALFIKGRIKNVIVTENGKNVYPEELETRLAQYSEIGEVLIVSAEYKGSVSVKAKIFPNLDFIKEKLGYLPSTEEIQRAVQYVIAEVNSKIPSYKHIQIIEILSDAFEKTTTQKIKRFGANIV